jgi:hypothetical protein
MPAPLLSPVDPSCVTKGDVLHDAGQRYFANLHCNMDMIGHKAKCMDTMAVSLNALLQQQIKTTAVFVVKENILTGVASHDHMVQCSRVMDSWFSCHDGNLSQ